MTFEEAMDWHRRGKDASPTAVSVHAVDAIIEYYEARIVTQHAIAAGLTPSATRKNVPPAESTHVVVYYNENNQIVAECSCTARWAHPITATVEQLDSIFESHCAYFKRPPMTTL